MKTIKDSHIQCLFTLSNDSLASTSVDTLPGTSFRISQPKPTRTWSNALSRTAARGSVVVVLVAVAVAVAAASAAWIMPS